jgi:hypothetical protein
MAESKRPSGHPPLDADDPSAQISVKLPSKQLADVCQAAQRERMTMPEWIRHTLRTSLDEKKS